jgi:hypothetical protein
MATLGPIDLRGVDDLLDSGVFPDRVGNQITAATPPSVGGQLCRVVEGAADEGWQGEFTVPKSYVGAPIIRITVILDGAPGASDTLGFGFRKQATADDESADGTFATEQTVSSTIGSSGLAYSDEDLAQFEIALTAGDYAIDDLVFYHLYSDASGTSYTGNVLVVGAEFIWDN